MPFALVVSLLLGWLDCFNNLLMLIILGNYSKEDPIKGMQVFVLFKSLQARCWCWLTRLIVADSVDGHHRHLLLVRAFRGAAACQCMLAVSMHWV